MRFLVTPIATPTQIGVAIWACNAIRRCGQATPDYPAATPSQGKNQWVPIINSALVCACAVCVIFTPVYTL